MRKVIPVLVLLSFLPAHGAAAADAFDLEAARGVFESKCSLCHSLDRALRKSKDRPGWEKTVSRMKRYASGEIGDEDAAAILEYLVRVRGPSR